MAQAELMRLRTSELGTQRGLEAVKGRSSDEANESGTPYAHPYYWAPFVLVGNWR